MQLCMRLIFIFARLAWILVYIKGPFFYFKEIVYEQHQILLGPFALQGSLSWDLGYHFSAQIEVCSPKFWVLLSVLLLGY